MATLTITVADALVPRIRTAFGHNDPVTGVRILATVAEIQDELKALIKGRVLEYETLLVANQKRSDVGSETW